MLSLQRTMHVTSNPLCVNVVQTLPWKLNYLKNSGKYVGSRFGKDVVYQRMKFSRLAKRWMMIRL